MLKRILLLACLGCLAAVPAWAREARERWGDLPYPEDAWAVGTLQPDSQPELDNISQWQTLAARMAERVKAALAWRSDIIAKPIFVQPTSGRAFGQAMTQMLTSELVSRGLQVSLNREPDSLLLEFNAAVVPPASEEASSSCRELLVTMSLWNGNRQILHTTSTYWVAEEQLGNYVHPAESGFVPPHFQERQVRLVNK